MKNIFLIIISLIIVSCSNDKNKKTSISGLIQNPTHKHIYIVKNGKIQDTIFLNSDGSFSKSIDIDESKFMVFKHPPEYQTFYIEPGDSLSFRLNTLDFDESLVFNGDSSVENNFLMDIYLMNEANNELILSYYKISADVFVDKTDSIKSKRIKKLEQLDRKNDFSKEFMEIAEKSISYEFFDIRERYVFLLKKYFPKKAELIDDSFFDYRESVNFNDADLINHFGYLRFLDNYLKNESVNRCISNKKNMPTACFELNSFNNIHERLKIVDSIFKHQDLKKKFLERFFAQEFVYASTKDQLDRAVQLLNQVEIDEKRKKELVEFGKFHKKFIVGNKIDQLPLKNHNKDTVNVENYTNKPYTAIHVWSSNMPVFNKNRFDLVKKMREKYDDINFIGINTDYNNYKLWQKNVSQHNLIRHHELQAVDTKNSKYYNYYLNRFTLIDQNGEIIAADILNTENDIKEFIINNTDKKSLNN